MSDFLEVYARMVNRTPVPATLGRARDGSYWWIYNDGMGQRACAAVTTEYLAELESLCGQGRLGETGQAIAVQVHDPRTDTLRPIMFTELAL